MPGLKVKHKKTSNKAAPSDATIIGSTDWNDDHTIVLDTRVVTGTTDTLLLADDGGLVKYTSSSAVTVTLPANFPVDFSVTLLRLGAVVTFALGSGASAIPDPDPTTIDIVGGYADLLVTRQAGNAAAAATGTAAEYLIKGDVA